MDKSIILTIAKADLGISVDNYNAYLEQLIELSTKAIEREGIVLGNNIEDETLTASYTAYLYRARKEGYAMPRSLRYMLNNKLFQQKMSEDEVVPPVYENYVNDLMAQNQELANKVKELEDRIAEMEKADEDNAEPGGEQTGGEPGNEGTTGNEPSDPNNTDPTNDPTGIEPAGAESRNEPGNEPGSEP